MASSMIAATKEQVEKIANDWRLEVGEAGKHARLHDALGWTLEEYARWVETNQIPTMVTLRAMKEDPLVMGVIADALAPFAPQIGFLPADVVKWVNEAKVEIVPESVTPMSGPRPHVHHTDEIELDGSPVEWFYNRWHTKRLHGDTGWTVRAENKAIAPEPNTFDTYAECLKRADDLNHAEQAAHINRHLRPGPTNSDRKDPS